MPRIAIRLLLQCIRINGGESGAERFDQANCHQVITWLNGFDDAKIACGDDEKVTFPSFLDRAKKNPNAL